jgi:hypothetical protein
MRRMHLSVEQHRQPQSPEPIIPMVMSSPSPLKCSLATSVASRIFPESHPYRRKHTEQQGYERPPNFGAYYQDDVRPGSTISSARTLRAFTPPITYGQLRSKALTPLLPYTQQQCYGGEANGHLVYLSQNFSSLSSPVQSRHAINPYFAAVQPPTHGLVNRWYQTQAESSSFLPTNKFDNHSITGLWPSAITTQRRLDKRLFFNSSDNKGNFPITQL